MEEIWMQYLRVAISEAEPEMQECSCFQATTLVNTTSLRQQFGILTELKDSIH